MLKRNLATTIILIVTLIFPTTLLINVTKADAAQFSLEGWNNVKNEFTTGLVRSYAEGDWINFALTIDNTRGAETLSGNVVIDLDYNITVGARAGAIGIDAFRSDDLTLWTVSVDGIDVPTSAISIMIVSGAAIDTLHFNFTLTVPADTQLLISWQNHLSITGSTNLYSSDQIAMGAGFWPGARLHVQAGLPGIVSGLRSVPIMRPKLEAIPPESTISGIKFDDANANGVQDPGEVGIEGWNITLYEGNDGSMVPVDSAFTGVDGDYIFPVNSAGHYKIMEILQDGWMQTAPTSGYYEFDFALGDVVSGMDFGNIKLGSISGVKFDDSNANGTWDSGEAAVAGWQVHLNGTDVNGTSVDEYNTTAIDGKFIFENLLPGTYTVTEVFPTPPPNWVGTTETSFSVSLSEGQNYVSTDFGNIRLGSISGHKFDDSNANGTWDSGEAAVAGWQVHLNGTDVRGISIDEYTTTNSSGSFTFSNLYPGTYTVTEIFPTPPPNWVATTATSFNVNLGEGMDYVGPDFGNIRLGSISGAKFYDANLNGTWDSGEVPIAGWKVHLTGTDVRGFAVSLYAFTDGNGKFVFSNLYPGTYNVSEVFPPQPPIYIATTATSFAHALTEGEDYTGPNFGNVCVKPGTGGLTLGFWTNKNGQALISASDVTALNALNLFKPTGWTYPPFSATLNTAKNQIKNYLLSATAVDMRWMLSAQLIATELDVRHGYLSASTIVYVGPSTYVPSGFITIGNIMSNANSALSMGTSARAAQEYWKNLLDGINNNRLPFVCSTPCPFKY